MLRFQAVELAAMVWSLARRACHKEPLLNDLGQAVPTGCTKFSPQELSNSLWLCGRLIFD